MSLINLEELLRPVSEAAPSGPNLEYSPEFMGLERAAQGKPEQRMGNAIVPGEPPDYRLVLEQSVALLAQTKDLRVAVHAVHALLHRGGVEGVHDGLALVRGLVEGFWPTLHPELDHDEDDDPTMRITALAALGTPSLLAALRALPLVKSAALGAASLKDIKEATAQASAAAAPPASGKSTGTSAATLEAIFQAADPVALRATFTWLKQALNHLQAIDAVFERESDSRGPDLGALTQLIKEAVAALQPRVGPEETPALAAEPQEGAKTVDEQAPAAPVARSAAPGEITSRDDVLRTLDKLCAYYARFEPSSPLPLLLLRCKRLVPMSFMDILRELAPDGINQVEVIAGKGE